jgi:hypothetical protein
MEDVVRTAAARLRVTPGAYVADVLRQHHNRQSDDVQENLANGREQNLRRVIADMRIELANLRSPAIQALDFEECYEQVRKFGERDIPE